MAKIRFKVGDKSIGCEIVSISTDMYNLICECENTFSRGFKMPVIPQHCRRCAEDIRREFTMHNRGKTSDGVTRAYTPEELQMIKDFKNDRVG